MSDNPLFLTIDVGTSGCKSAVIDPDGHVLGLGYREYPIDSPQPGWAEQDPYLWWEAARDAARQACTSGSAGSLAPRVVSVSVSSQREGVVPVGKDGRALSRCIIWLDTRTSQQAEEIARRVPPSVVLATTGLMVSPVFSAAKIMWIRDNQPGVYERTHKFLQAQDFLLHKLTGEFVTDESIASRTMLFDVSKRKWASKLFAALGLDEGHMPRLVPPGTVVGVLTREAARELGLRLGTVAVAAGGDQQCGLLGVGSMDDDRCSVSLGTSTSVCLTIDRPLVDEKARVSCCCAAVPGMWDLEAPIWTSGALLRWYRDMFAYEERERAAEANASIYDIMMQDARAIPAGSDGLLLLPHFAGAGSPHWDPDARGLVYGLTLSHGRAHLIRAIIEGVAYEVSEITDALLSLGVEPEELVLSGGGARSPLFRQVVSDVTGKRVVLPTSTEEAVSLGSAMLAAVSVGVHESLASAVKCMTRLRESEAPDPASHDIYEEYKKVYRALRECSSPVGRELRSARERAKVL